MSADPCCRIPSPPSSPIIATTPVNSRHETLERVNWKPNKLMGYFYTVSFTYQLKEGSHGHRPRLKINTEENRSQMFPNRCHKP